MTRRDAANSGSRAAIRIALILAVPGIAAAMPVVTDSIARRSSPAGRIEMTTDVATLPTVRGIATGSRPTVNDAGVIDRDVMVHCLRVDVLDSADAVLTPEAWRGNVAIYVAGRFVTELDAKASTLSLPRPLGLRMRAGDTLQLIGSIRPVNGASGMRVRLTLDLDSREELGLVPVSLIRLPDAAAVSTDSAVTTWLWTSDVSGRALAMTGRAIELAQEIVLVDEQSGAIVWRELRASRHPGFVSNNAIRVGARLVRDRAYRLVIRMPAGTRSAADVHLLVVAG